MDILQRFKKNWHDKQLIDPAKATLLAVSGGVDSMVMASLFHIAGIPFGIAHCNFQLRGEDADKDEALVQEMAAAYHVPFHNIRFDTEQKTKDWKKGIQETARILRYEWLDEVRIQHGYAAIATAHHANDNAETLLINLLKGTGIAGLHGIREQNGCIIRPLLFAERKDILAYASQHETAYREDASNTSDKYLRNAVRHHIIPAADKYFPDAVRQINNGISRFAEAEILYNRAIEAERKKLLEKRGNDWYVPLLKLKKTTPLDTICYELFRPFGFSAVQIPEIKKLFVSESGHYVSSATHRIIRNRDFFIITELKTEQADILLVEAVPCIIHTAQGEFVFAIDKADSPINTDANIATIDMKRLTFPLILRRRKEGDYFYPLGMGMKKKKLSKYLKDSKTPLHQKDNLWVLECDKRIVWIAGMRLDERFKVKDSTSQILKITYRPS